MNCPNCGAALEMLPGRTHLRCPYCTSLVFPQPVEEGIVLLERDHAHSCPTCDRRLVSAVLDGGRVGYCPDCRGILLDSDHFAHVVTDRRTSQSARPRHVEPIDAREFRRAVRCPRCQRRADTHAYGGGGNAVIDSCARCRLVWLDAGELTVLAEFGVAR